MMMWMTDFEEYQFNLVTEQLKRIQGFKDVSQRNECLSILKLVRVWLDSLIDLMENNAGNSK